MRSGFTGHISSTEWRWVILVASFLVILAFFPFLWVLLVGIRGSLWQFMGALHQYQGSAPDLARAVQGSQGYLLTHYLYTPEPHDPAFIAPLYTLLGQISRLTTLSPIVVFHAARAGAALFMYTSLYYLASTIWMRLRTRRIFFVLAAVGSGLGWLFVPLTQDEHYLDITVPPVFPFFSSLVDVHTPLAIACLSLAASMTINAFRPGATENPTLENGALMLAICSLVLALVYPLALIPLSAAFVIQIIARTYKSRQVSIPQLRWYTWFLIPAVPILGYYVAVFTSNEVIRKIWEKQNNLSPLSPIIFILSLGLMLALAFPGIVRGIRRFEPDGDQFMLIWLLSILIFIYLPIGFHQRFAIGCILPITYFATRAIEDFWFNYIGRKWRIHLMVALLPILAASNFFVLLVPLRPITGGDFSNASGLLLQKEYLKAFSWLNKRGNSDDVVLASPTTSLWLPIWTGMPVVYGHPTETLDATTKRRAVLAWYRQTNTDGCEPLLRGEFHFDEYSYVVKYVVIGPQEIAIGNTVCTQLLNLVATFDQVRIYEYAPKTIAVNQ